MLLQVNHIKKTFPLKDGGQNVVIQDLSFSVEEGSFVSLLGPSGCGKTTVLTMIGGFASMTAGEILLDGKRIKGPGLERGYVFQNYALFPWKTVKKNILYSLEIANVPKERQEERLKELLELSHLQGHENKFPIQLSGGMQQRVALIRALASRPRILLLDEPLGAVDFQMREIMQNEMDAMVREAKVTVVMVTHDVNESVFLSDRVIILGAQGGRLLADVAIDIPRVRDRSSQQFKEYANDLTDLLRQAFNYN